MEILRNLWRRRLRSGLTVAGIAMGIFALTTMGSMAEHFNVLIGGGVQYYAANIQIADDTSAGTAFGGTFLPLSVLSRIRLIPGVAAVAPSVGLPAKPGTVNTISFGVPDYIANWDPATERYSAFKVHLASGRWVTDASRGQVVLGSTLASEFRMRVGRSILLPIRPSDPTPGFVNHRFTVVGILEQTLTAPDNGAFVSLHDAQRLEGDALPAALRGRVDPTQLISGAIAYGDPGVNLDRLANRITDAVAGVKATEPSVLVRSFESGGAIFTFMTTAAAVLALVIGGLSVVNTMIMSVTERVREIGLKKAIGAKTHQVLREFLLEATVIGLVGGVIGFGLGAGLTLLLNAGDPSGGLFLITWRLAVLALVFALALGAGAGILPALRAARMDPVAALRSE